VSPQSFASGAFTLTVSGSNFVNGAQVLFAGAALNTTFVSATKLTATGTAPSAGTFAVTVQNPNPGASMSNALNVQVTSSIPPPDASYVVISPAVGAVRGNSVQVNPAQTTAYTLSATNQFGRTAATVTVTVQ
jgi:hypothetical protein